jgi:EAL domain-containing protein (putative c-di-GMP-specific phosphodiesterase class I)
MRTINHMDFTAHGEELMRIIREEAITPVFQPIVSLRDGSVLGYEALSRGPVGTEMESPDMLFQVAEAVREIWELERLCRAKALAAMQYARVDAMLFLNVNPSVAEDVKFQKGFTKDYLGQFGIGPDRVIFEITERSACQNIDEFKRIISDHKGQQYKIALDDAGAGYSHGREEQFPVISISIAGVRSGTGRFADIYSLSAEAGRVKKECQVIPGNAYLIV